MEMTKAELVAKLAEEGDVTKKAAAAILDGLVKTLHESLKAGEKIRIDGLGTFVVVDRKARTGVNPQTRAKIKIPATKAPAFRAAKALKDAVKPPAKKETRKEESKCSRRFPLAPECGFVLHDGARIAVVVRPNVERRDSVRAITCFHRRIGEGAKT